MKVNEILNKYSKEVIIEWICNRYPVLMNKDIKKELDETKNDLEFDKITKELDRLFAEQKKLREKPFNASVAIKMEKNRNRISFLVEKQSEMVMND
jgi:hypothetical protein